MTKRIPSNDLASYVTLSPLFTDNMIFQRDNQPVLFGMAEPNKKFMIRVNGNESIITSDDNGNWTAHLDTMPAGGSYECNIIYEQEITVKNIVCGDIYLCSGQSNMEMQLDGWGRVFNYKNEIANANFKNIRLLKVDHDTSLNEQSDINTSGWKICSSESVAGFSAAAYFFAKELVRDVDIPIGLIQSTWPGSPIEAWMSRESLSQFKENKLVLDKLNSDSTIEAKLNKSFINEFTNWEKEIAEQEPTPLQGNWKDHFEWHSVNLPYMWQERDFPEFNGSVLFRKNFEVPTNDSNDDFFLSLGPVKDSYSIWINDKLINSVSPLDFTRVHRIPKEVILSGNNEIVVRVFAEQFGGGFWGKEEEIKIYSNNFSLSFNANWYAAKGVDLNYISQKPKNPTDVDVQTVLFNSMINPLTRLNIKGILWYQGESNVDEPEKYNRYFKALITDWRKRFNVGDIPFLFVQLTNYEDDNDESKNNWAGLREAQESSLTLNNTGMVCSIDIGDANDIHPRNKKDIGVRLALLAKKMIYDKNVLCAGPKYINHKISNDSVIIDWAISGDRLKTNDSSPVREFLIASADKEFHIANAVIDKYKTIVSSYEVTKPVAVRYAWANNPSCNLTDDSGLPALPFRTDSW
ncbi:MAG: sialate O-acetylesterase [Ignavibacteriaceae bacterium]